ncbi:hypothetical protein [Hydrogenivirga sp. 128-5-R1-1]|uniref:hypothetical protein n=1 Tax=Hydrogenivirga sp. 128-5-R1-1 TaxID=392423 RepID=UPI00015F3985|nr:hypothetical protein [Hydrogenivirga sp. 128-5-R1-1]EDP75050.1 hypothetical protein HG1285_14319 [Hydrogenivirga sp. 128-5-R1-1]
MEVSPFYILLAKLEDEISFQRKVINTFMFAQQKSSPEITLKTIDILRRLTQSFRLIALVIEEVESMADKYMKEQALLLSSECLSLSSLLLPALEGMSPIFLDSLRVYEEPILERIESVAEFIENSLQDQEELATDELAQTIEDIMRTLEYHIKLGERAVAKII